MKTYNMTDFQFLHLCCRTGFTTESKLNVFASLQGPPGLPGMPGNPGLPVSLLTCLHVSHPAQSIIYPQQKFNH